MMVIQKENFELLLEDVNKNEITKEEALEIFKNISNLTEVQKAYLVSPEKVNIRGRILNFFTNNYQFDY